MNDEHLEVIGDHDEQTIEQLRRCVLSEDGARGVLCADGHLGYSQPIGGAVAYREHVSPSGVGYDIGCIAAGTPVVSELGWHAPIERVAPGAAVTCWDGEGLRAVEPNLGAVARGRQAVLRLGLADGRELVCTPDHEIRTKLGWKRADALRHGEPVACVPFAGLPYEPPIGVLDVPEPDGPDELGLWPPRADDPRLPALLRLTAYVAGDGHLSTDGSRIALYSSVPEDAIALRDDVLSLGVDACLDVRERGDGIRTQYVVRAGSRALHATLRALGVPAGRKTHTWTAEPFTWLHALPAWMRAHFLSSFASAEATTPAIVAGRLANVAIKQAGVTPHAIRFVADLLESLGFRTGVSVSGPVRGGVTTWVVQVLGGEKEQLRFVREIGFCRAIEKRRAAAAVLSVVAQRQEEVARRAAAIEDGRARAAAGHGRIRDIVAEPDSSNEVAWIPVRTIAEAGTAEVYDIATGDGAECFVANGVVVHNCGNKAARTTLRADDLRPDLPCVMDEIVRTIEFGVGRKNQRRADHPVLDEIKQAAFEPQRKLHKLAAEQLGTVGSGNHYVNVMADEDGWVWVGVHFGSRGFGHKTASGFLALHQGLAFDEHARDGEMHSPPVLFHERDALGEAYVEAMELALRYAYAGRDVVVDQVLRILGTTSVDEVHNNHNDMRRETHGGVDYWVVRKGCTPAFPGQKGFVGASMGEPSVVLEGVDAPLSARALYSTVHGAGRAMSRTKAAGRLRKRVVDGRKVRVREGGAIDFEQVKGELRKKGIELRGGAADEAPGAYKRLNEVLAYHGETVRVLHTLTPLGVAMAGEGTYDPYKD